MTRLERVLARLAFHLSENGSAWALVGGLAVGSRTEPRFTKDVDVMVAVAADPEAERVVRALLPAGYRVAAVLEQRLATVRLSPPDDAEVQ